METVSVIIPTFNRAILLKRAVISVINQTYPVSEIFICDDGSTDNSKELIATLDDSRIAWLDCGRSGRPAIPRNTGIRKSSGNWIAMLDDDDEWLPEKISKELKALKDSGGLAVCCNAVKRIPGEELKNKYTDFSESSITFDQLIYSNYVICSSSVFHRSLLDVCVGFPEEKELKAVEDYVLWLRIATQSDFIFLNEDLLIYNDFPEQSIRSESFDMFDQRMKIFKNLLSWCSDKKGKVEKRYNDIFMKEYKLGDKKVNPGIIKKLLRRL